MLKYMENSIAENVTNREIAVIHNYVNEVKHDRKAGIQYMKSWEREKMMKEEGIIEGKRIGFEEGQQQINALYRKLVEIGRIEDIIKASSDTEYQKKLLMEFAADI